jgi:hypothetical protein
VNNALYILLIVLILAVFLVVGPWLTILAVNQLFGTSIQLTFLNWLSVAWLHLVVANSYTTRK